MVWEAIFLLLILKIPLVYLCCVEKISGTLRCDLGVVVQDHGSRQHEVPAAGRPGEHRPGADVLAGRDRRRGPLRRIGHGQELPARNPDQSVRRDQRVAERVVPVPRRRVGKGVVLDPDAEAQPAVRAGQALGPQPDHPVDGRPRADQPAGQPPGGLDDVLRRLAGVDVQGQSEVAAQQLADLGADLLFPLDCLVPGGVLEPVDGQRGNLARARRAGPDLEHPSALELQEPDGDQHLGVVGALDQALGLAGRRLGRIHGPVGGRHQHAELEPGPVLLRRLAVGVEQVALVHDGVGDLACLLQVRDGQFRYPLPHGSGSALSAARSSRAASVASHVGRASRDLNLSSSSSVAVLILIQALSGKCASMASRQMLTGRR